LTVSRSTVCEFQSAAKLINKEEIAVAVAEIP